MLHLKDTILEVYREVLVKSFKMTDADEVSAPKQKSAHSTLFLTDCPQTSLKHDDTTTTQHNMTNRSTGRQDERAVGYLPVRMERTRGDEDQELASFFTG